MKTVLISCLLIAQLIGDASYHNKTANCFEIQKAIQTLEAEKEQESIATRMMLFIGIYVFGKTDTVDEKIQLLKLQLQECHR